MELLEAEVWLRAPGAQETDMLELAVVVAYLWREILVAIIVMDLIAAGLAAVVLDREIEPSRTGRAFPRSQERGPIEGSEATKGKP
jgi:hypothetical protein